MLDYVDYLTLLQYSPRGNSQVAQMSRKVKSLIKAGRLETFRDRILQIISENQDKVSGFLNPDITLVPAPRSSPTREADLWPAYEICKMLESYNLGAIATCLKRSTAIKKSSLFYNADERPSVADQFDSMKVENDVPSANITLVDDVLTMGRTSFAGASKLAEKFPNATVRVFSLIQTRGFIPDIDNILNVQVGTITYNHSNGKCNRPDVHT